MFKAVTTSLISAALILSGPANAAPRGGKTPGPSPALDALAACRAIADSAARLACYDQASARFTEAVSKGEVVVMDKQEIRQTRRSLFGFQLPRIPLFRGEDKADVEQDELTFKIVSASGLGYDKYRMRVEEGGVWETTDAVPSLTPPRAGQTVVIKRGALGNYFLRINGQPGVRGRRVG